ncbi:MAG TPA: FAD:protein FMN transferase [Acidimicrobiia bacterium]|nr:FAD:protein FMN transferase [Acidimicrobiia bacterium]
MSTRVETAERTETRFRAMGTTVEIVVVGGPRDLPARGRTAIDDLESRWSRFRPSSEISRLNDASGRPVVVSRTTFDAIARAVEAWYATNGRYDPTVLDAVRAAGYDRDFSAVPRTGPALAAPVPAAGCGGIELDRTVRSVRLPRGVTLDLGGIGKGLAADLVAYALVEAGADGALVNVGGDARVLGTPPRPEGWIVGFENPLAMGDLGYARLAGGAVCTSTRTKRKWTRGGVPQHHLIDPATGAPSWSGLASVTVLSSEAWWAEILAKAAFVAGPRTGRALLASHGVTGLLVHDDGRVDELEGLEAFR